MRFRGSRRSGLVAAALALMTSVGFAATSTPASAATFNVQIAVTGTGAATGTVSGIGTSYTTVLTATGSGTCALANSPFIIASYDTGSGNPAGTNTIGAPCSIYNGTVEYTLTYTSTSLGVTGTFYRTCLWELGVRVCSPPGVALA